jgi:hypothetical protein
MFLGIAGELLGAGPVRKLFKGKVGNIIRKHGPLHDLIGSKALKNLSTLGAIAKQALPFVAPESLLLVGALRLAKGYAGRFGKKFGGQRHVMPFGPGGCRPAGGWINSQNAKNRYGSMNTELAGIVNNPNLSLEEKVVLLAGLMADKLDREADTILKKWGNQMQRTAHQGNAQDPKGTGAGQGNNAESSQYHQVQLQRILQKKNQMISLASNVSKSEHETKKGVIHNMRV